MKAYFEAVGLGAFTWKNEERLGRLFTLLGQVKGAALAFHFFALSLCLYFPLMYALSSLSPWELLERLGLAPGPGDGAGNEAFSRYWLENGYGALVLAPFLGMAFLMTLVIQGAFYLSGALCLGLARMRLDPMPFRERAALLLFSSTLPCIGAAVFGLFLPVVHILVFYFTVIFLAFQRNERGRN